ncbi:uncharacterized [Tachysurus ichikawai]
MGHVYSVLPAMRGNLKTGPCALGVSVLSELCLVALPQGSLRPVPSTHPWPGKPDPGQEEDEESILFITITTHH